MEKDLVEKMRWRTDTPDLFKVYPDIKTSIGLHLSEIETAFDIEKYAKYIILCYHTKSPLILIENFVDRQKAASKELGINIDSEEFKKVTHEEEFNYAIVDFVALENNPNYALLIANENVYRSAQAELMQSGKDTKKKLEALKHLNDLHKTIEHLKMQVFSNDKIVGNYVSSFTINKASRKISPEDYALAK